MKVIIILMFLIAGAKADTISIDDCYKYAYETYPNRNQKTYYSNISDLRIKNLNVNYLPQFSIIGQASYQSAVPEMTSTSPFFSFPKLNKDRYQLYLELKQNIFDGGSTSTMKDAEKSELYANLQKVEVDLYQLRQRVNDLYFSVLLLQEKKKVTQILYDDIETRLSEIESKIINGVVLPSNKYILEAELLKVASDLESVESDRMAAIEMLGKLIEQKIDSSAYFIMPETPMLNFTDIVINRPELRYYELEKNRVNALKEVVPTRSIPKLNLFGQLGVGKPGLNFLDNSFKEFYLFGVNLIWNPVNWNSNNYEIQILTLSQKIIDTQKETFEKNLEITLEKFKSEISKYEELIQKDKEITELRKKVVDITASQLENGVVTSTNYVTELNSYNNSLLMLNTHQILLNQAKINYITAKGIK
ncbi:MAG: TolC family protein [Ignavibacteria bacterium]|nr:TolC family protein [Ignavibacteria bacterium]